jgi:hypothetical protein
MAFIHNYSLDRDIINLRPEGAIAQSKKFAKIIKTRGIIFVSERFHGVTGVGALWLGIRVAFTSPNR